MPAIPFDTPRPVAHHLGDLKTAFDIAQHFRRQGDWVDWARTTDTFKAGDPSRPVRTVAVAWKATWDALRLAVGRGADLFVTHESIAVNAANGSLEPDSFFALPTEKPKFDWLAECGLVVYRCHDFWDRFPGRGIRDSWRDGLQLGGRVVVDQHPLSVTEIAPTTVGRLARHVLAQIAPLGQDGLPVAGDPEKPVRRVATGTGVCVDPFRMIELGADVGIMTDDFFSHVRTGAHAAELGFPMLFVNHGVAEEWGIRNLAAYLSATFPELNVFHIPQRCPYAVVTLHEA